MFNSFIPFLATELQLPVLIDVAKKDVEPSTDSDIIKEYA